MLREVQGLGFWGLRFMVGFRVLGFGVVRFKVYGRV